MEDRAVGHHDATKDQRRATRLRQTRRRISAFSSSEKPTSRESRAADASRDRRPAEVSLRDADRVEELRAEARYRRERLQLYKARMYRGSARSQTRLRELQRSSDGAAARLERSERVARD